MHGLQASNVVQAQHCVCVLVSEEQLKGMQWGGGGGVEDAGMKCKGWKMQGVEIEMEERLSAANRAVDL